MCLAKLIALAVAFNAGCVYSACTDGNVNSCLEDHCGSSAAATQCMENGRRDRDCCAWAETGSCAPGYFFKQSSEACSIGGPHTSCCYPDGSEVDPDAKIKDECSPDNTVNKCLEKHCGVGAASTQCLENGAYDPDCCTFGTGSCAAGHTFRESTETCHSMGAYTSCCYPDGTDIPEEAKVRHYDFDMTYCSEKACTSPGLWGTTDCWAGTPEEACSCSEGMARTTGETSYSEDQQYFEYVCCTDGTGGGEQCGNYGDVTTRAILGIIFWVIVALGVLCGVPACIACCYYAKCCCFAYRQSMTPSVPGIGLGPAQPPVVMGQPIQAQVISVQQPQA